MATFRPLNLESDAAHMARIHSTTLAEPITEATARDWWSPRAGEFRATTLALDADQIPIGYWDVEHETWMRPGQFWFMIILTPEARGQGLGARMYADALSVARRQGATHLDGKVRDNDTRSLKFAECRGFKITYHTFESTLDLGDFDEHRFDELMARVRADGFRFFSLAEAGVTDRNKRRLYEVNRATALDSTGSDGTFPDYYAFSKNVFDASWFRADTQILAALEDRWVGLSAIGIYPEDNHAYNAFTGVLPEFRKRGLAQALKLQTILLAKREGVRYVRTNNDSKNAPILAVNRKLGYKPEPGYYRLLCELS